MDITEREKNGVERETKKKKNSRSGIGWEKGENNEGEKYTIAF